MSTPTIAWIVLAGLGMSALALTGSLTLAMSARSFDKIVLPLVSLAAGSLLGGALFHMLPAAISQLGNHLTLWAWLAAGVFSFFLLEQFLHWHHCHRRNHDQHRPLGYLILVADGVHNFIGGLAVGTAFVVDVRLGAVTWLVAAAHEVPQELGDFGILVHSGWSRRGALVFNVVSALPFLVGGVVAYVASSTIEVAYLLPFAAGNFIYVGLADLVPELTTAPTSHEKAIHAGGLLIGLGLLYFIATAW